jgi:signal peptidase I
MTFFSTASRQRRKARRAARDVLAVADKVWAYRRDQLDAAEAAALTSAIAALRTLLAEDAGAEPVLSAARTLSGLVTRLGGTVFPKTGLGDNVEFLLVLVLVVLGIRAYFVQYFVIPTNSMWPTYNGMTPEVFATPADEPGPVREVARILTRGAWPHRLDASADGEVLVPVGGAGSLGMVHAPRTTGRAFFVIPARSRACTLLVGDRPVTVVLPEDFDFDWAVYEAFFDNGRPYSHKALLAALQERVAAGLSEDHVVDGQLVRCVRTGKTVRSGERLLAFDEMAGDKVLVDRLTYHFFPPHVGSGFVFRTADVPGLRNIREDTFYVKRLVGLPGDTIEVRGSQLYRNGAPIAGSAVFQKEALRQDRYPGYEASGSLEDGGKVVVPPGSFFAMGDNSPNSYDGRMWGFVPAAAVVGRPMAVYYPLLRMQPAP